MDIMDANDPMEPYNIAAYVISMMHDGHSRANALNSAVVYFDLDGTDYREVLAELVKLERDHHHDLSL